MSEAPPPGVGSGDPLKPLTVFRHVKRQLMARFDGKDVRRPGGPAIHHGRGPLSDVPDDEVIAMVRALPVAERVNLIHDLAAALVSEAMRPAIVVTCQADYTTDEAGWRELSVHAHQLLSGLYALIPQVFDLGEDTWGERTQVEPSPPPAE